MAGHQGRLARRHGGESGTAAGEAHGAREATLAARLVRPQTWRRPPPPVSMPDVATPPRPCVDPGEGGWRWGKGGRDGGVEAAEGAGAHEEDEAAGAAGEEEAAKAARKEDEAGGSRGHHRLTVTPPLLVSSVEPPHTLASTPLADPPKPATNPPAHGGDLRKLGGRRGRLGEGAA